MCARTIHQRVDVTMTPMRREPTDETDAARDVGLELLNNAMTCLRRAAEEKGFLVEVDGIQVVY